MPGFGEEALSDDNSVKQNDKIKENLNDKMISIYSQSISLLKIQIIFVFMQKHVPNCATTRSLTIIKTCTQAIKPPNII